MPASKKFSISCLVDLGDHLDQRFARGVDGRRHVGGNGASVNLPLSSVWKTNAFRATRSTTPLNDLLLADRQLNRDDGAVARVAQRLQRALEAGPFAVEAVEHDQARQAELLRGLPHLLGLHHHAGDCVDDDQRGVGDVQRRARIAQEVARCRACRSG